MSKQWGIDDIIPAELFDEYEPVYWWQMLEPIEWDYFVIVHWEMFPSGCVVVYE